jgi:hypothetical protein
VQVARRAVCMSSDHPGNFDSIFSREGGEFGNLGNAAGAYQADAYDLICHLVFFL